MVLGNITIYSVLRPLLRWLPSFLLRRYYSADGLAKLVYLDFQPRHESAWIDLGEASSVRLTLQLINLSPFVLEIDRAGFQFTCGSTSLNLLYLERKKIEPGEIINLLLQDNVPDGQANQISRNWKGNPTWLVGNIEFNCAIRNFQKNVSSLSNVQLTLVNENVRTLKCLKLS